MKANAIWQFLQDVGWGELEYLVVDSPPPPGTGDDPLSVFQLIKKLDGAVIVTTPQKAASVDVRKSITFCRQLKVPVLCVIENMRGKLPESLSYRYSVLLQAISKKGFWFKIAAEAKLKPEAYSSIARPLSFASNNDIGPKDSLEMACRNSKN